ncbi:MAG TPA: ParA family protein [Anaerolineales bacterium]|nr:ParA family protein [Anaerolineales bacterium]
MIQRVLSFANEKGGVGKTTSALSLGAALAEQGEHVLLVDLDPQANLTLGLGFEPATLSATVADTLLGNMPLDEVLQTTDFPGLDLAPASDALLNVERYLPVRQQYEMVLRQAMAGIDGYTTAILDCPPALGATTRCALTASDVLIIPTQCEYYSAHALRQVVNLIRTIRQRSNPRLRYRLLLTMLDRRNGLHRSLAEQIRRAFGRAVFATEVEIDARLREAPAFGQPVTVYAPTSRGAQQYRQLAEELREHAQETIAPAA